MPGQVFYDASRKLILRGVDGIVFVADSQEQRMDANVEALENLMSNLKEHGYDFNKIPYVLQLNKRDLPNILPVDLLSTELRKKNEPLVEAVAFQGVGVFETLKEIAKQVLTELKAGGGSASGGGRPCRHPLKQQNLELLPSVSQSYASLTSFFLMFCSAARVCENSSLV